MIANELRIGNIIGVGIMMVRVESISSRIISTVGIDSGMELSESPDYFNDMQITPELLGKLGFIEFKYGYKKDGVCFRSWDGIQWSMLNAKGGFLIKPIEIKPETIKGLHQLQNLYFIFRGMEINTDMLL